MRYERTAAVCAVAEDVADFRTILRPTERRIRVHKMDAAVYHLAPVPARHIDVVETATSDDPVAWIVEAGRKAGEYDGAVRWRIRLHGVRQAPASVPPGRVAIERGEGTLALALLSYGHDAPVWHEVFPALRTTLSGYRMQSIVWWQAQRYYPFLASAYAADVQAVADAFAATVDPDNTTLAEANQRASRDLYRLARMLGWHKLTLRERERLGLADHGQWVSETEYADAQRARWAASATGAGEDSLDEATGRVGPAVAVAIERIVRDVVGGCVVTMR